MLSDNESISANFHVTQTVLKWFCVFVQYVNLIPSMLCAESVVV